MSAPLLLALLTTLIGAERPDIVLADFEAPTYGAWTAVGEALGAGPAQGTLPSQMQVSGYKGRGLVNTYRGGDGTTGSLTSPPFVIERNYLNFLIGGGRDEQKLTLALLVDGKVVRTATGPNDRPGGSERLSPDGWDVSDLAGRTASLRIVDEATGGWGHINVDQIVLSDRKVAKPVAKTVELAVVGRYLHLPVRNGGEKANATLTLADGEKRHFEIELATDGQADWWAPCDLGAKPAGRVTLTVDRVPEEVDLAKLPRFGDTLLEADNLYHEALRPQFHFSPKRGWTNDPNGLVYHDGEWHLFFQHNPYGVQWGNMHWGHAVSPDLMHWTELDEALYPDPLGPMFSGSAVIDEQNTSGLGNGKVPPLVAIYTASGARPCQCLAVSSDRGRTFTKYAGNPVLPHIVGGNRDPKVIWYAPGRKWVMALYLDGEQFGLFESKDLKAWTKLCDVTVPGCSECPEFFEIGVEGKPGETRWVFYGGNGRYMVGRFDGKTFTAETGPHLIHHGNCWYASQTYNGVPAADGRRILVAWGQVQLPGMAFNQQMSFPIELTLHPTADGLRLYSAPAREIAKLRARSHALPVGPIADGAKPLPEAKGGLYDVEAVLEPGTATQVGLNLRGFAVTYDVARSHLTVNGVGADVKLRDGRLKLRLLVDRASIEAWAQDGEVYLPVQAVAGPDKQAVELTAKGAGARLVSGTVHELKPVWK
ncbi:MAG: glycoside hydrolase family 32 protein [Armatimonadetes bacterium]|nr:glycoside hydrolase family 32 protein [Armatimonadota bacterium]